MASITPEAKEIHPFFKRHHTPEEISVILQKGGVAFERHHFTNGISGEYFVIGVSLPKGEGEPRIPNDESLPSGAWWYIISDSSDGKVRGYYYPWNLRDTIIPQELLEGASLSIPAYLK